MIRTGCLLSAVWLFLSGVAMAGFWTEVTSMPDRPSLKSASDGASLTMMPASGLVYATKGGKTNDFYSYSPGTGAWLALALVPEGPDLKQVKAGGCVATDRSFNVYLVKGGNTTEFYRYSVDTLAWRRMPDVPRGSSGKKVKAGDMVAMQLTGAANLYFLKAVANELYFFGTADTIWHQLSMPQNQVHYKWNSGSFLVFDGDHTIYAHKSKYHELWTYNIWNDSWCTTPLPGVPFVGTSGRSTKCKVGSCGVFYDSYIYALKGGNTGEFWRYDTASRKWAEMETLPKFGSAGKRKGVKGGGDMVVADSAFYVLKGNKTREFWKYTPGDSWSQSDGRQSATASSAFGARQASLTVAPNPVISGYATLSFTPRGGNSAAGPLQVDIRNAAGQVVVSRTLGTGREASSVTLDLRRLSAGVYLVNVTGDGLRATQKLIVQR